MKVKNNKDEKKVKKEKCKTTKDNFVSFYEMLTFHNYFVFTNYLRLLIIS